MSTGASVAMDTYQCHKKVAAAKIVSITEIDSIGNQELHLDNGGYVIVDEAWRQRNPKTAVGGYYVVYIENTDRYSAYSPAEPFEAGYTKL